MHHSNIHIPETSTKTLKVQELSDGRKKLVISTNMLSLFGFEKGSLTVEETLEGEAGFQIRLIPDLLSAGELRPKKVYERSYKRRQNNPLHHHKEVLIDVRRQALLKGWQEGVTKAHIRFEHGLITVRPHKVTASVIDYGPLPLTATCMCSSGIDALELYNAGFAIEGLIEFRPDESRDVTAGRSLTETGVMNTLTNVPVKHVVNEDVMAMDLSLAMEQLIGGATTLLHASPVCSEFTNAKAKHFKDISFERGDSTLDMTFDVLRVCEAIQPQCILVENVPGYMTSDIYKMFSLRMRRWGYTEYSDIYTANEYGGLSGRKRYYGFFTKLAVPFAFLPATAQESVWDLVEEHLHECRDVSENKAFKDGRECGRLRELTPEKTICPTITRSQSRMAKDSLVISYEGKTYFPSEKLLEKLQGLPDNLDTSSVAYEQAVEIIGQSVDGRCHERLIEAIKSHIEMHNRQLGQLAA